MYKYSLPLQLTKSMCAMTVLTSSNKSYLAKVFDILILWAAINSKEILEQLNGKDPHQHLDEKIQNLI